MGAKEKFIAIVDDLSSLEVATFTKKEKDTDIAMPGLNDPDGNVNSNEVFKAIRANLTNQELVGYVRFEIDGDALAFVNNDSKYADIVNYHKSMIEAGQQTRKNILETIVGVFKDLI